MNRSHFSPLFVFGIVLLLAILACGGAGTAPEASEPQPTQEAPAEEAPSTEQPDEPQFPIVAVPIPAIPETRRLTIEYPPRIRAGDSDVVRLTLEVDEAGNITPTAVVDGNVINAETIEIPNLYETHYVIAEARFDVAGLQVSPTGLLSQTLSPGQTARFFWSIRPDEVGTYRGTAWLHLRFVDKVSGEESQTAVSAQIVEIESVNLFGIPANLVRVAGGAGSLIGSILGFPFLEDAVRFVFRRRRRETQ
jgi:hypothetical protein